MTQWSGRISPQETRRRLQKNYRGLLFSILISLECPGTKTQQRAWRFRRLTIFMSLTGRSGRKKETVLHMKLLGNLKVIVARTLSIAAQSSRLDLPSNVFSSELHTANKHPNTFRNPASLYTSILVAFLTG